MIYLGEWNSTADIAKDFDIDEKDAGTVWLGVYSNEGYEGKAFVLTSIDGKLMEVNGEHCSCNGLETQWAPAATTVKALQYRMTEGELGCQSIDFTAELNEAIRNYMILTIAGVKE